MQKLAVMTGMAVMCVMLCASQGMALTLAHNVDYACVNADTTAAQFETNWTGMLWTGHIRHYQEGRASETLAMSYIKFSLSDPNLTPPAGKMVRINYAGLYLHAATIAYDSTAIEWLYDGLYAVSNDVWDRATMTYSNRPAMGVELDRQVCTNLTPSVFTSAALAAFIEQEVNGDRVVTFGLRDIGAGVYQPDIRAAHPYYGSYLASPSTAMYMDLNFEFVDDPDARADFSGDGIVNFKDLALFAQNWLRCVEPTNANCEHLW